MNGFGILKSERRETNEQKVHVLTTPFCTNSTRKKLFRDSQFSENSEFDLGTCL